MTPQTKKNTISLDLSKQNTQVTLGATIFIFILALLIIFLIRPTIVAISNKLAAIKERETATTGLASKINNLNTALENYNQLSPQLDLLTEAVPDEASITETLKILEKNASEVVMGGKALAISKITIEDLPDVQPLNASASATTRPGLVKKQEIPLRVTVRGDYEAAREFVQKIKNNRRNFYVERLTLSAPKDRQGKVLDISISLITFYYGS